jgi:hypothetical protein
MQAATHVFRTRDNEDIVSEEWLFMVALWLMSRASSDECRKDTPFPRMRHRMISQNAKLTLQKPPMSRRGAKGDHRPFHPAPLQRIIAP